MDLTTISLLAAWITVATFVVRLAKGAWALMRHPISTPKAF